MTTAKEIFASIAALLVLALVTWGFVAIGYAPGFALFSAAFALIFLAFFTAVIVALFN